MLDIAPLQRIDFCLPLEVLSALHIGTGESHAFQPDGEAGKFPWQVSTIVRDHQGKPYIPGSSLKGLLRGIARELELDCDALLGVVKENDTGRMGALHLRGASQTNAGDAKGLPFAKEGVFISGQTAIDNGRGISDTNKLFHAEAVAPGAWFEVRLRLEAREHVENLEQTLLKLLAQLTVESGVGLGADGASGLGRVKLVGRVIKTPWQADPNIGVLRAGSGKAVTLPPPVEQSVPISLRLHCEGPYLQRNFSWDSERRRREKNGEKDTSLPHLQALRHGDNPYLTGDTVSGALRARLEWLAALAKHRNQEDAALDSRRLFGDVGQRGVLTISVAETSRTGSMRSTSVRIDRFSGGAIDNALYATDSDYGVTVKVNLELDSRATEADKQSLDVLVRDIRKEGLQLGHGTGKGFGWFRVEE